MRATQVGMILGTAGYMAPEQAAGQAVDKRADIWAFGVVFYEMLTGQRLFSGDSVAHVLADVLRAPIDFDKMPAVTPRAIRDLVKRCLDREVKTRLRDIGEARIAIQVAIQNAGKEPEVAIASSLSRLGWVALSVAALLLVALSGLAIVHFRETAPETPVVRTFIPPPEKTAFLTGSSNSQGPVALSPDGKRMVFTAVMSGGTDQLWVRSLDALMAKPLSGTEGAMHPFFSPDSKFIGFFGRGKLKKVDVNGGPPIILCDAPLGRGGTWNQEGIILFSPGFSGPLHRVSAAGGVSSPVTVLDLARGENTHRWPWFLPDGRHFLYSADTLGGSGATIRVASIDSQRGGSQASDSKVVVEALSNAVYAQGHLLFLREDTLVAQPFDLTRLITIGEAVPVAENVLSTGQQRRGVFSISGSGLLVYLTGGRQSITRLAWFDRSGKKLATLGDAGGLNNYIHFSSDRKAVAVSIIDPATGSSDIWLYDVVRGLRTRFTFDPSVKQEAVWSPDGNGIIFDSAADLYRKASSGAGAEELLYADKLGKSPKSWSPDGKFLLYTVNAGPKTGFDNWVLPLTGERKPFPFAQTAFNERNGQFSPDGRWIAYSSDESQRNEIYVALFSGSVGATVGKRQISTAGGAYPRWRRDGKELFYIAPDRRLMAAEVSVKGTTLEVGAVHPLFGPVNGAASFQYDVSADGQRILAIVAPEQQGAEPLTLVQNWAAALKK